MRKKVCVILLIIMFMFLSCIVVNGETLGNIDVEDVLSIPSGEIVKPDSQIEIVFSLFNNDTVQQTISFTPQWSQVLRYVTVPADSTASITILYPVQKTVDYGGTALNLEILAEIGEQSKLYSYQYTVESEPSVNLETYIADGVVPTIGQAVTITTEVTNTGNVPLTGLVVTHTVLGDTQLKASELLPGQNKLFNSRVLVSADMIKDGSFTNVSTLVTNEVSAEPFVYMSDFDGIVPEAVTEAVVVAQIPDIITTIEQTTVPLETTRASFDGIVAEMPKTGMSNILFTLIIPISLILFSSLSLVFYWKYKCSRSKE